VKAMAIVKDLDPFEDRRLGRSPVGEQPRQLLSNHSLFSDFNQYF